MINSGFLKQKIEQDGGVTRFAESVGVSRTAVYGWLSGETQPESSKLFNIAEALNLSERDVDTLMGIPPTEIFFRKTGRTEPAAEIAARGRDLAETFFKLHGASFVARDHVLMSAAPDPAGITSYIRSLLSGTATEPLTLSEVLAGLKKHNIAVFFLPFAELGLSGARKTTREVAFTARKGSQVIIFVDTARTRDEALFDICHELAHLISLRQEDEDADAAELLCNDVAQELVYPVQFLKLKDEYFQPFLNASKYSWNQARSAFSLLARELDWSPGGLAIVLAKHGLIKEKSHEHLRLMKLHQASAGSRPKIDSAIICKFTSNDFPSIQKFFSDQIGSNPEVYRPFIELKEAATFGRLSSRKLAELLRIDSGDADELVSAWTQQLEQIEAQADNGSVFEAR